MRALFLQSLSCQLVASAAAATAAASVGCKTSNRPDAYAHSELKHPVGLSPCYCPSYFFCQFLVLLLPQVCDLLLLLQRFLFQLVLLRPSFSLVFQFLLWRWYFLIISTISWYLFSSSGISIPMFFSLVYSLFFSCRVFLSYFMIRILPKQRDCESCHDTSVVTSHVDHVIGFGVLDVFQVSSFC